MWGGGVGAAKGPLYEVRILGAIGVISEEKASLVYRETKQPLSYKDACITMNPNLGYSPDATAKTIAAVTGELRGVFRLP